MATRRARKNAPEAKYNMPRSLKTKLSQNQCNKKIKVCNKFGIKFPNINRDSLIMDSMNNNTPWKDAITKEMYALERLYVL